MTTISIETPLMRRLTKLAKATGATPEAMLPQVMLYGFPAIEDYVRKVAQGVADAKDGRVMTAEQATNEIMKRRGGKVAKQEKAA